MLVLYNIAIRIYGLFVWFASNFNPKAKAWVSGRKNLFDKLRKELAGFEGETSWFHVSSLGEYEMAKPLIEELKKQHPTLRIVLTFFSPSGYEVRKENSVADFTFYLPLDTPKNAVQFVQIVNPIKVFFVKYDLWYNHLNAAKENGANLMLISAQFNALQSYFKWFGASQRRALQLFDNVFLVDEASKKLLSQIGVTHTTVCGDTRYDRVMQNASIAQENKFVEEFKGDKQLIICGSTWVEDEELLVQAISRLPDAKWLIAPHEVDWKNINRIKHLIPNAICFSNYRKSKTNVLILDSVGLLNGFYKYADVAYVGGGFKTGLHNILEATAFGTPTIFGPDTSRFPDAEELHEKGLAFKVNNATELISRLQQLLSDKSDFKHQKLIDLMQSRTGATEAILEYTNKC